MSPHRPQPHQQPRQTGQAHRRQHVAASIALWLLAAPLAAVVWAAL